MRQPEIQIALSPFVSLKKYEYNKSRTKNKKHGIKGIPRTIIAI